MSSMISRPVLAAVVLGGFAAFAAPAQARVEAGMLTCEVSGGFSLIFSSPRDLHCVFYKSNGLTEAYGGRLREVGIDIGATGAGVIAWSVVAESNEVPPGVLTGTYAGAEAGGTVLIGAEGRVLIGGSNKTIALQPLSVEGNVGLNLAVGIASMELRPLFQATAYAAPVRMPAVGHGYDAVPAAQQAPHYGCGSYTHLARGQTIFGVAHACGVTVEALLDANPQITNVRNISAGALIHVPSHVGHHAASPCGDRAIVQEAESLEHLAWRCGVTLHALLVANPTLRDMAQFEPGLVVAVPERTAPPSGAPVRYAANETQLEPVVVDARPSAGASGSSRSRPATIDPGQERACVAELADTVGIGMDRVRVTARDVAASGDALFYLDAAGNRAVCEVDRAYNVRGLKRTGSAVAANSARTSAPASGSAPAAGSIVERVCLEAVAKETNERNVTVLSNEFSQANSLVMVGVGAQRAPWRCLVSNNGVIAELLFAGNDGDGVQTADNQSGRAQKEQVAERDMGRFCAGAAAEEFKVSPRDIATLPVEAAGHGGHVVYGQFPPDGQDVSTFECHFTANGVLRNVRLTSDSRRASADTGGDAKVPGTDYNATGEVPCSMSKAGAVGSCPFGVQREGNGSGIVTITKPDGRTRGIFFENGKAIGYDESQADRGEFRASKQGDMTTVHIGAETYSIPDAVIYGG